MDVEAATRIVKYQVKIVFDLRNDDKTLEQIREIVRHDLSITNDQAREALRILEG